MFVVKVASSYFFQNWITLCIIVYCRNITVTDGFKYSW